MFVNISDKGVMVTRQVSFCSGEIKGLSTGDFDSYPSEKTGKIWKVTFSIVSVNLSTRGVEDGGGGGVEVPSQIYKQGFLLSETGRGCPYISHCRIQGRGATDTHPSLGPIFFHFHAFWRKLGKSIG